MSELHGIAICFLWRALLCFQSHFLANLVGKLVMLICDACYRLRHRYLQCTVPVDFWSGSHPGWLQAMLRTTALYQAVTIWSHRAVQPIGLAKTHLNLANLTILQHTTCSGKCSLNIHVHETNWMVDLSGSDYGEPNVRPKRPTRSRQSRLGGAGCDERTAPVFGPPGSRLGPLHHRYHLGRESTLAFWPLQLQVLVRNSVHGILNMRLCVCAIHI